jgi:hypothetical protein
MEAAQNRLSRRSILAGLAVGGAGVGAAAMALGGRLAPIVTDADGNWWDGPSVPLETASLAEWRGKVGETFEIGGAGDGGSYKLVDARPMQSSGDRPADLARQRAFAVEFEAITDAVARGNQTYAVRHGEGMLEIFFAIADPANPTRLVAVFN